MQEGCTPAGRNEGGEEGPALLPVRMLNEFTYCPRLFHIEWVQGEFADNAETVDGRYQHRRVDRKDGKLPVDVDSAADESGETAEGRPQVLHTRSVWLSAEQVGLTAKIDLIELSGWHAVPVEYKRGRPPDIPERAWEPERVQVCAQGLILREKGFSCDGGVIYFVETRQRVEIPFDDTLVDRTLQLRDAALAAAAGPSPPPLADSPKCPRCSLAGICLPDEVNALAGGGEPAEVPPGGKASVRRIITSRADAMPLVVQQQGARITKRGERLVVVTGHGPDIEECRLLDVSQVSIFGNVQVTAQALNALVRRGIPLCHFSYGGWFQAITTGLVHRNIEVRRRQFRAADDEQRCLELARGFVEAKIRNARTLVRRNHPDPPRAGLTDLSAAVRRARTARSLESLLGFEGTAARVYFGVFGEMLKGVDGDAGTSFDFSGRNRRPPRDPVNAMLSFAYAMLTRDVQIAAMAAGLDPLLGFYHQPRYGRPSLALDLMEEFRPLIADSVVLTAVNTGVIARKHFIVGKDAASLTDRGRKAFIRAYERRMDELITHPVFGYRIGYRRVLEVQARLLARYLLGEIEQYPMFLTR